MLVELTHEKAASTSMCKPPQQVSIPFTDCAVAAVAAAVRACVHAGETLVLQCTCEQVMHIHIHRQTDTLTRNCSSRQLMIE